MPSVSEIYANRLGRIGLLKTGLVSSFLLKLLVTVTSNTPYSNYRLQL